jgi:hypothetical protein
MNIQTSASVKKEALQRAAREAAYSMPLKDFHPGAPQLFRDAVAVFRAAAQGRAGALLHQLADRTLLVGDQIQRHHACRH